MRQVWRIQAGKVSTNSTQLRVLKEHFREAMAQVDEVSTNSTQLRVLKVKPGSEGVLRLNAVSTNSTQLRVLKVFTTRSPAMLKISFNQFDPVEGTERSGA